MKKIILILVMILSIQIPLLAADLNEMIGQMIIVGFVGDNVKSKEFKEVLKQVNDNKISGVIFFEDNIKNKEEFLKMTSALKNSKAKHPPFIAIDMEGGYVQRMNKNNGFQNFKSAKKVAQMSEIEAYDEYYKMAEMLKEADINLNFAPCVDIAINKDSIIDKKERSYSNDPKVVVKYAKEFINAHKKNKIITSVKHFPGHGSPSGDTHLGLVDATKTYKEFELYPYLYLANLNDMQTVMISHVYNKNIDERYPASLSYKTIEKFLRIQTNFDGVIITDDLDMGAIRKNYGLSEIVSLGINAGENILLFSNRFEHDKKLVDKISLIIKQGLIDGYISPERINDSYDKIIKLKKTIK